MNRVNATPSNPLMEAIHSETTLLILSSLPDTSGLQCSHSKYRKHTYYTPLYKRSHENTIAKLIQHEAVQLDCHHLVQNRQPTTVVNIQTSEETLQHTFMIIIFILILITVEYD